MTRSEWIQENYDFRTMSSEAFEDFHEEFVKRAFLGSGKVPD